MIPIISINIACYNRKEMLRECLESFLAQTFEDFEIIVVDDGSEDDLLFVKDMDNRIKYLRQKHKGISAARNLAFDNSIGKYIMPFDSDDLATSPEFLSEILKIMENNSDVDVIYTDFWIQQPDGSLIRNHIRKKFTDNITDENIYREMLTRQFITHPGSLWRKDKMPRYDESLESAVDWELFLSAIESGVKFKHQEGRWWTYRTGHPREFRTQRQTDCCDRLLNKRGYTFNKKARRGEKICN
jgi:glycosyltransferase involved in cell wall biosynthesis